MRELELFMKRPGPVESASGFIDEKIKRLSKPATGAGRCLQKCAKIIPAADPEIVGEWRWMRLPSFPTAAPMCTGETYTNVVKMTFEKILKFFMRLVEISRTYSSPL
jgi:hypothetical protein